MRKILVTAGAGFNLSIEKTFKIIQLMLRKKLTAEMEKSRLGPKKSEANQLISSNIKAKKIFKWKPKFSNLNGFKKGFIKYN